MPGPTDELEVRRSKFLTLSEAARVLGVSRQMLYLFIRQKTLRPRKREVISRREAERLARRLRARWAAEGKPGTARGARANGAGRESDHSGGGEVGGDSARGTSTR